MSNRNKTTPTINFQRWLIIKMNHKLNSLEFIKRSLEHIKRAINMEHDRISSAKRTIQYLEYERSEYEKLLELVK